MLLKVLVFFWQKRCYREYEIGFHNTVDVSVLTTGVTLFRLHVCKAFK